MSEYLRKDFRPLAYPMPAAAAPLSQPRSALLNWPAVVSLAAGAAALVSLWVISIPIAAAAVVMGHVGLRHSSAIGVGRGQAIGGLVLGYLSLAVGLVVGLVTVVTVQAALQQAAEAFSQIPTFP